MLYKTTIIIILAFCLSFFLNAGEKELVKQADKKTSKTIPADLQKLIDRVKMLDDDDAYASLEKAVRSGNKKRLKVILYLHPNFLNKQDTFKRSPLFNAVSANQLTIVKYLILKKADVMKKDINGNTPLHEAVAEGYADITKYLLKNGAKIFATNKKGENALFKAASNGEVQIASFLIDKGLRVNGTDKKGNTPLHRAAYKGQVKMVNFLLALGADKKKKNKKGQTPSDLTTKLTIKKKLGKK